MVKIDLYKRFIWLADLIYRHDGITRTEINRQWNLSHLNGNKESEIPERTFHRYKKAINDLFDIDIVCNRQGEKTYHISNRDAIDSDGMKSWLLNTFSLNSLLSEHQDLKHRIVFESKPSGPQFLIPIMESMRDNTIITLEYKSFKMSSPTPHTIEPYCLKFYNQRWYVIGRRIDTASMRTFALDRIKSIERTGIKFNMPDNFDAEAYFADFIGITVDENIPKETIRFIARNGQQYYIRSLPLHPSQREISTFKNESVFEIVVRPTSDLFQEFLRFGKDLEVVAPAWIEERMREICSSMKNNYKKNNYDWKNHS